VTTVYYSPHMTSLDNELGRASGHADVPLSERGLLEAGELARHYAHCAIDAVFCSDLQRASRTAELAFSSRDVPIIRDARLRECDYGILAQYPSAEVHARLLGHLAEPFPGGESLTAAVERVGDVLRDALRSWGGKTLVIIGHRATRYGLEYWCSGTSLERIVGSPWERREIPIWRYEAAASLLDYHMRGAP